MSQNIYWESSHASAFHFIKHLDEVNASILVTEAVEETGENDLEPKQQNSQAEVEDFCQIGSCLSNLLYL